MHEKYIQSYSLRQTADAARTPPQRLHAFTTWQRQNRTASSRRCPLRHTLDRHHQLGWPGSLLSSRQAAQPPAAAASQLFPGADDDDRSGPSASAPGAAAGRTQGSGATPLPRGPGPGSQTQQPSPSVGPSVAPSSSSNSSGTTNNNRSSSRGGSGGSGSQTEGVSSGAGGGSTAPSTLLQDAFGIASFALPLATQNVLGYSLNAMNESLVGRLGPTSLSASTLANSAYSLTGISLVWGGAAGMETLCGQAYGARNLALMRLVLMRAVLVCWAMCVPIVALWSHGEQLLLAMGQSPVLVAHSAGYLQALVPSLFVYALSECLQVFLVSQGLVRPTVAAKAVVTVLGPLYYYLCMFWLDLGLLGAAYAYALCKGTNAVLLLGWLAWRELRGGAQRQGGGEAQEEMVAAAGERTRTGAAGGGAGPSVGEAAAASSSGGGGGGDGDARAGAHVEMPTSPLPAAAASAHELSLQQPAVAAGAVAAAAVGSRSQARTAHVPPAAATTAAVSLEWPGTSTSGGGGGVYDRLRRAAAAARAEVAEVLEPRACWEYVKFGLPAAIMSCLEWWAYEAMVIMAGWLPNAAMELGCLGICMTVSGWVYMVPQAIATAACARVSNALGAGDAVAAKRGFQAAYGLVLMTQLAVSACLLPNTQRVALFFCPDPSAGVLTASLLSITAINTIGDGANCVLNSILRACGRQALGARLQLMSYWCCGLPLAYVAAFKLGMGVKGFVMAIGAASLTQSLVVVAIISRWDWQGEVRNSRTLLTTLSSVSNTSSASRIADS